MQKPQIPLFWAGVVLSLLPSVFAPQSQAASLPASAEGLSVSVDEASGTYAVTDRNPAWKFSGTVGAPLTDVRETNGKDALGSYRQIAFGWEADAPRLGAIRLYNARPLVQFSLTTPQAAARPRPRCCCRS